MSVRSWVRIVILLSAFALAPIGVWKLTAYVAPTYCNIDGSWLCFFNFLASIFSLIAIQTSTPLLAIASSIVCLKYLFGRSSNRLGFSALLLLNLVTGVTAILWKIHKIEI
jgi:hypothetical protein